MTLSSHNVFADCVVQKLVFLSSSLHETSSLTVLNHVYFISLREAVRSYFRIFIYLFIYFSWNGVRLIPLDTSAIDWLIVPVMEDD